MQSIFLRKSALHVATTWLYGGDRQFFATNRKLPWS